MVKLTYKFLKSLPGLPFAFILFFGIAGLGTLTSAALVCEPDCPVHQVQAMASSCCEIAESVHHEAASGNGDPNTHETATPACCDGKLCFDSGIDIHKTAAIGNNSADTMAAASKLPVSTSLSSIYPPGQHFFNLSPPQTSTPIYIRTCVFLI